MLNTALGELEQIGGDAALRTKIATEGHVLYGPYERLEPGRYVVNFTLGAVGDIGDIADRTCAILDIVSHGGRLTYARKSVSVSDISAGLTAVPMVFDVPAAADFEYRILCLGEAALLVLEKTELLQLPAGGTEGVFADSFPSLREGPLPTRLLEDEPGFRMLYERGADIHVEGEDVVVSYAGLRIVATDLAIGTIGERLWRHGLQIDVSYADADEDVILFNALRNVRRDEGFYIDVGANDPEVISVTKLFYDRGWHGINIEPSPTWYAKLQQARPRDINLQVAVSDISGVVTFFDHADGGLGTIERRYADQHHDQRGVDTQAMTVPTMRLADICAAHATHDIHFLKIDVEGHEAAVIRSMDFVRFRPWLLCIEATEPMNVARKTFDEWDRMVAAAGYVLARADHLNRYYVARERVELISAFREPPRGYVKAA